ncbi:MAG TPA: ABC transporter permease [Vicinamibacterales bacterium]|nr:ABC transporter permease [Vicinamibacterales bacterium]
MQDLHYAWVSLRRSPGLAITVLLTFALGVGTTTAVFSVVHGILLRPLTYPDPGQLVRVWEEHPGGSTLAGQRWLSNRTFAAWSTNPATIEGAGAFASRELTVAFEDGEPLRAPGAPVSPVVFRLLRATPSLGRFFEDAEARPGANRVVVLSDRLWRDRFAAAPDVLGRTFAIDGEAHTIVGVARASLEFPDRRVLFWIPNVIPDVAAEPARTAVFSAIARLRPGVTPAQAEAEGTAAARSMPRPQSTDLMFGKGGPVVVHVRPLAADMTTTVRPALLVVTAAVVLLLLIGCANIANLLLSRGIARERELAIRVAIGASRARLVRQLLTESAALSLAGGAIGLVLAALLVRTLPAFAPARLPRLEDVRVDWIVMGFSVASSLIAGLAAGVAPALRASRPEVYQAVRGGGAGTGGAAGGPQARHLRSALLVIEAGLAVLLVVGAGLLARSFTRLVAVDAGYTADRVLTARVQLPRQAPPEQTAQFIESALDRLRRLPGVAAAGAGSMMPMNSMTAITTFTLPAPVAGTKPSTVRAVTYTITPGYAEALSLRLHEGRFFAPDDRRAGVRPVLVNREFVQRHINGRAVGRRLGPLYDSDKPRDTEIVGIVGNVLKDGNDRAAEPEIYFVQAHANRGIVGFVNLVVRTTGDPAALADDVRALVREADGRVVVERIEPLASLVRASVEQPRFGVTVVTTFAALALVLAAIGLYGVMSYNVSQRRKELGIRSALGASRAALARLVLREALSLSVAGVALGLVSAALLTRLIQSLLFGVSSLDPLTYATAPAILLAVALSAGLIPASRAARTDPARVLND